MSAQTFLQAELRLLYEYDEHTSFVEDAQRILKGLATFNDLSPVTLADALDQAGAQVTTFKMHKGGQIERIDEICEVIMSDGAQCGYDLVNGGVVCDYGHRQ